MPGRYGKQRGVALIMVLLAMALVVVLATGMISQQSLRVFRASHYLAQQQGYTIATGAETFARSLLYRDYQDDQEAGSLVDSPDEFWARYALILPMDIDGLVEIQIEDLGGRINLNDLVGPTGQVNERVREQLQRLFRIQDITTVSVDAVIDWIDADGDMTGAGGGEDSSYRTLDPPYLSANQPFVSVSELRLMPGMTEQAYHSLRPNVSALPRGGAGINVNMAPLPVLQSLAEELTERQALLLVEHREQQVYNSVSDFLAQPLVEGIGLARQGLTVNSSYFEVVSRITYAGQEVTMVSTVFRNGEGEVQTLHRDISQRRRMTREPYTFSEG